MKAQPLADPLSAAMIQHMEDRNKPGNTITSMARTLRSVGNAGTATREDVEAWWKTRADLSPSTQSADLSNLRGFYKWCRIWEHRDDDPTLRVEAPKVPNNLPRPIARADLLKILDTAEPDIRRAVALGAYGGLRVSECAALRWDQVDAEMNTLDVVASKGGKSRRVLVSPVLLDALLPSTGIYVVSGTNKKSSASSLQQRANRAIRNADVDGTFHQLRHRYGTMAYQATGDLLAVGRMMGHSSPVTTSVYAQANDDIAAKIAMAVIR